MSYGNIGVPLGTLILTLHGLVPIESIQNRTPVLTATGVFHSVSAARQSVGSTVHVSSDEATLTLGVDTLISLRGHDDDTDAVAPAYALSTAQRWATPVLHTLIGGIVPQLPTVGITPTLLWLAGRWLASGTREGDRFSFITQRRLAPSLAAVLEGAFDEPVTRIDQVGDARLDVRSAALQELLLHFTRIVGDTVEKTLPLSLMTAPLPVQQMVYVGFLSAEVTPASARLALGLRFLAANLGVTPPARPIALYDRPVRDHGILWSAIRSVVSGEAQTPLYTLDAPTMFADGIVLHNESPRA